jgi:hypothetical protein
MKNLENSLEAKKNIMKALDDEIKEKQKQKIKKCKISKIL